MELEGENKFFREDKNMSEIRRRYKRGRQDHKEKQGERQNHR